MGNSSVRTSNAYPQIIRINHLQHHVNYENEVNFDNADGRSIATAAPDSPDSPKLNHSLQIITEILLDEKYEEKRLLFLILQRILMNLKCKLKFEYSTKI
ncbi:unnamed protein product [Paramecium octaurelia]|uniref:Uncharacterized protein n=1 Tax=Paramecium octaurelia TaxID=43137 RepID=A0A8S1WJ90_PAROT|nr:unnamed protein product [Paramecium octaurelia]